MDQGSCVDASKVATKQPHTAVSRTWIDDFVAEQIQNMKPTKPKDLEYISQTLRNNVRQQCKERQLTQNSKGYVHIQDLRMNMVKENDHSITPQDITKIIERPLAELRYTWGFCIREDKRCILVQDRCK